MASKNMEEILQRLNLGTLIQRFKEERIDPQVINASTNNEPVRLGICTIEDRMRLRELCRNTSEEVLHPMLRTSEMYYLRQVQLLGPHEDQLGTLVALGETKLLQK